MILTDPSSLGNSDAAYVKVDLADEIVEYGRDEGAGLTDRGKLGTARTGFLGIELIICLLFGGSGGDAILRCSAYMESISS